MSENQNAQEHAPPLAGASAEPSVEPQTREEVENKAAGDGCVPRLVLPSSFSSEWLPIELAGQQVRALPLDGTADAELLLAGYKNMIFDLITDLQYLRDGLYTSKMVLDLEAFKCGEIMVKTNFSHFVWFIPDRPDVSEPPPAPSQQTLQDVLRWIQYCSEVSATGVPSGLSQQKVSNDSETSGSNTAEESQTCSPGRTKGPTPSVGQLGVGYSTSDIILENAPEHAPSPAGASIGSEVEP